MTPYRYEVGDTAKITEATLQIMRNSNRSAVTTQYPSDRYIKLAEQYVGKVGVITHTFPPGYEVTFMVMNGEESQSFHMKDNWIEAV